MSAPSMSATLPKASALAKKSAASNRLLVIFCFFAIYVIWGSTYLAIRYAVETIPPLYAAGIRHITSGTILLLWCLVKKVKPTAAQVRTGVVIGRFVFSAGARAIALGGNTRALRAGFAAGGHRAHLCIFPGGLVHEKMAVQLETRQRNFAGAGGRGLARWTDFANLHHVNGDSVVCGFVWRAGVVGGNRVFAVVKFIGPPVASDGALVVFGRNNVVDVGHGGG